MKLDHMNDMIVKLSVLEVTLEGARDQIREIRDDLKREPIPSAPQTAIADLEKLVVGKIEERPLSNDPIGGRRRAKCECGELHWNGRGKPCDTCKAALPIGVT